MNSYLSEAAPEAEDSAADWLSSVGRIRTTHLQRCHDTGQKFSVLTSYDAMTAAVFDQAGIEVLLIGDSAGNVVYGHDSTVTVTLDELIPLVRGVSGAVRRALVLADLPFGSYEQSPAQAVASGVRLLKEGGAHAVKMEGGAYYAPHVEAMVQAGIPVMAHIGYTPQRVNTLGGHRVQGRDAAAASMLHDALALQEAGAFAVLLEMSTEASARAVVEQLDVPTVGIGATGAATGQVLVWQDMMGLNTGRVPRFVKRYADLAETMGQAARAYRADVVDGNFPAPEHLFEK